MKILAWDLEHGPNLGYIWGLYKQNVALNQIAERGSVLSFGARYVGEPKSKIRFFSDHHTGHDDMIRAAWDLIDEADALLSWNGVGYDTGKMNREFYLAGMTPPSPVKEIDLLKTARSRFGFVSNKLENIAIESGLQGKVQHSGFSLWVRCLQGDPKAWAEMAKYNKQDVHLLIDLYYRMLPWIKGHPNAALIDGEGTCPKCKSDDVQKRGTVPVGVSLFQQYWCKDCGSWFRGGKRLEGADLREVAG